MNNLVTTIRRISTSLQYYKKQVTLLEIELQLEVSRIIKIKLSKDGQSLRDWARSMNISAGYACDIIHSRRKISKVILAKFMK